MNWVTIIIIIIIVSNIWYYGTGQDKIDAAKKAEKNRKKYGKISCLGPISIHDIYCNVTYEFTYAWYFKDIILDERCIFLQLGFLCKNNDNSIFHVNERNYVAYVNGVKERIDVLCKDIEPGKEEHGELIFQIDVGRKLKSNYNIELIMHGKQLKLDWDKLYVHKL